MRLHSRVAALHDRGGTVDFHGSFRRILKMTAGFRLSNSRPIRQNEPFESSGRRHHWSGTGRVDRSLKVGLARSQRRIH